jgi:hypothetical protein
MKIIEYRRQSGDLPRRKEIAVDTARLVEVEFSFIPNAASVLPLGRCRFFSPRQPSCGHAARPTATDAPRHDGVAMNAGNAISGANSSAFGVRSFKE